MSGEGIREVRHIGRATLYWGDCLDVIPETRPRGVDAIITDPPYFKVKDEPWDHQWDNENLFLQFIRKVVYESRSRLAENGSFYLFASPQMAGRVECVTREYLQVLNTITWDKANGRKGVAGTGIDLDALRRYWTANSEKIIFAEQYAVDKALIEAARNESDYFTQCEAAKRQIMGDYLASEIDRAGASRKEIAELFPSKTGGVTGCVSNWVTGANMPTPEQYNTIRDYLNQRGENPNPAAFLARDHSELKQEYDYLIQDFDYLRTEYEQLRAEYEAKRRPFDVSEFDQWGDVWTFAPVRGPMHPCEKPAGLINQILKISTRPDQVVGDWFMGSGAIGACAVAMGREFVGIEKSEHWFNVACDRIEQAQKQQVLFA